MRVRRVNSQSLSEIVEGFRFLGPLLVGLAQIAQSLLVFWIERKRLFFFFFSKSRLSVTMVSNVLE